MNTFIQLSSEFGLVIRKAGLVEKNISREEIINAFEGELPVEENEDLISFGPHFGLDHAEIRGKLLQKLGLEYIDDFFYFYRDFSSWARLSVALIKMDTP